MGLKHFWEYVIANGWQVPPLPEDEAGNFICPFCECIVPRIFGMDEVPEYDGVVYCPKCGRLEDE